MHRITSSQVDKISFSFPQLFFHCIVVNFLFFFPSASATDFTLVSSLITFFPSSEGSPQCLTIDTTNDTILELDERLSLQFESTDIAVNLLDSNSTVTIMDNDGKI